jgi:hypothetical protein
MVWHRQLISKHAFFILIHLLFQYHMNGLIVIDAIVQAPSASQNEAFIAYFAGEPKDAQTGLISLLGVLFAVDILWM